MIAASASAIGAPRSIIVFTMALHSATVAPLAQRVVERVAIRALRADERLSGSLGQRWCLRDSCA